MRSNEAGHEIYFWIAERFRGTINITNFIDTPIPADFRKFKYIVGLNRGGDAVPESKSTTEQEDMKLRLPRSSFSLMQE